MKKKQPWYKKWGIWLIGITVLLFFVFGIPLIINMCYIKNEGYITVWSGADVFQFYGSILSFIGTVVLGILALWQNHVLSEQNDRYQKMLESKDMPNLVAKIIFIDGLMSIKKLQITNLTDSVATDFMIQKCGIRTSNEDKYFYSFDVVEISDTFFAGKGDIIVELQNKETNFTDKNTLLSFELIFQFTDIYGRVHNKIATKDLKNSDSYFSLMKINDYKEEETQNDRD